MGVREPLWVVTGAGGFLGNNLIRLLLAQGAKVRAAVFEDHVPPALEGLGVEVVQTDVRDLASVERAFTPDGERPTWVVHCAGIVSIASSVSPAVYDTNVTGIENVIESCRTQGVARLVYVSSIHALSPSEGVVTEMDSPEQYDAEQMDGEYSKTKSEATRLVLEANDIWRVVVLPTGMIGPNDYADTHLTRMVRDVASGALPVSVGGGYDFVDVRDVSAGIIAAAEFGQNGRTYILSGAYWPVAKMVAAVANAKGRQAPPKLPLWSLRVFAPLAEFISKRRGTAPIVTSYSLKVLGEPGNFYSARARKELGYTSREFRHTLKDTLDWVETHDEAGQPVA